MDISERIDKTIDIIQAITTSRGGVRNTANYQCMIQLRDCLRFAGMPNSTADHISVNIRYDLPLDLHMTLPDSFDKLVLTMAEAIMEIYETIKTDYTFNMITPAMIQLSKQMNIAFEE
jgi:hypothetical protein